MKYTPITPGGTMVSWICKKSEAEVWKALLKDTQAHRMPYRSKEDLIKRGYTVVKFEKLPK
jgi:hypothetical protein